MSDVQNTPAAQATNEIRNEAKTRPLDFAVSNAILLMGHGVDYEVVQSYDLSYLSRKQDHAAWRIRFDTKKEMIVERYMDRVTLHDEVTFLTLLEELTNRRFSLKR